jgi:hypothetical protein
MFLLAGAPDRQGGAEPKQPVPADCRGIQLIGGQFALAFGRFSMIMGH